MKFARKFIKDKKHVGVVEDVFTTAVQGNKSCEKKEIYVLIAERSQQYLSFFSQKPKTLFLRQKFVANEISGGFKNYQKQNSDANLKLCNARQTKIMVAFPLVANIHFPRGSGDLQLIFNYQKTHYYFS